MFVQFQSILTCIFISCCIGPGSSSSSISGKRSGVKWRRYSSRLSSSGDGWVIFSAMLSIPDTMYRSPAITAVKANDKKNNSGFWPCYLCCLNLNLKWCYSPIWVNRGALFTIWTCVAFTGRVRKVVYSETEIMDLSQNQKIMHVLGVHYCCHYCD